MTDREQIEELYREYWQCMIRKDVSGLRAMMAKDYTLEHMTGLRQSAEVFLKGLQKGTFNYSSAEHDSIQVRIEGDRAILVGKSRVLAAVYGGGGASLASAGRFHPAKGAGGMEAYRL